MNEVRCGLLEGPEVLFHAGAAVEQKRQGDGSCWRREKNVTFCLMPSSKTLKSGWSRSVM